MPRLEFWMTCLALFSHACQVYTSTLRNSAAARSGKLLKPTELGSNWKCMQHPLQVLAKMLVSFNTASCFDVSSSGALKASCFDVSSSGALKASAEVVSFCLSVGKIRPSLGPRILAVDMTIVPSEVSRRAELKRLKAEKAALELEKMTLELEALKIRNKKMMSDKAAETESGNALSQQQFQPSVRGPRAAWPEREGKYHRFVAKDDPSFKVEGLLCKSRSMYLGTREEGTYEGSFRVRFTLPGRDNETKVLELLPTSTDNPSFGAVKISVENFLMMRVVDGSTAVPMPGNSTSSHVVVQDLDENPLQKKDFFFGKSAEDVVGSAIDFAYKDELLGADAARVEKEMMLDEIGAMTDIGGIRNGDIIRAMSLPPDDSIVKTWTEFLDVKSRSPWWMKLVPGNIFGKMPELEEGLVILDGKVIEAMQFVEAAHMFTDKQEMVMIIERPSNATGTKNR